MGQSDTVPSTECTRGSCLQYFAIRPGWTTEISKRGDRRETEFIRINALLTDAEADAGYQMQIAPILQYHPAENAEARILTHAFDCPRKKDASVH